MPEDNINLLKKLRGEVNDLDKRIVSLLEQRFMNSAQIGSIKKKIGVELHSPEREDEIFNNIMSGNTKFISQEALKKIYRVILDESLAVQEKGK